MEKEDRIPFLGFITLGAIIVVLILLAVVGVTS